jgi:hypothetical protein
MMTSASVARIRVTRGATLDRLIHSNTAPAGTAGRFYFSIPLACRKMGVA